MTLELHRALHIAVSISLISYFYTLQDIFFFFFLMIRRPPRSTLFPTRRSSDLPSSMPYGCGLISTGSGGSWVVERSEEHTSELQSLAYLVCRLLLEKKKAARA